MKTGHRIDVSGGSFASRVLPRAALVALYVAVSVVTRAVVLRADIINGDEASYAVGAWEMLRGNIPYTAFADNKPPLIYAYYALAQAIGGHGIFSVRLLTMLITVPWTAYAASAFYGHTRRGVVAALLFLVYSAAYEGTNMLAVNCELVMLLPLAWSLVVVRGGDSRMTPGRALGAGVLVGTATLVKYQSVLWLPAIVGALILDQAPSRWKAVLTRAAVVVAGFLLPLIGVAALFVIVGGFEGFWYWNVVHNVGYVLNPTTVPDAVGRSVVRLAPFFIATVVLWIGWARLHTFDVPRYQRHLVGGLLAGSMLAIFLGLRFFGHYFVQLYIPLALGAAPWVADRLVRPMRVSGWMVTAYTLAVLVFFTAWNGVQYVVKNPGITALSHSVTNQLALDPCYGDGSLFIWGSAPTIYYHAQLPLASRFFFPEFPLVRYYSGNRPATALQRRAIVRDRRGRHWRWLMTDLDRHDPTFILDMTDARVSMWEYFPLADYPLLESFVKTRYEPMRRVGGVQIYRRRGCEPRQQTEGRRAVVPPLN